MRAGTPNPLYVGWLRADQRWGMPAHTHDHHEMIVVLGGAMHVGGPGLDADCRPGDVLLYPAGVAHAERTDVADPVETIFFGFRAAGFESRTLERRHDHRGRIREMARWLHEDRLFADPVRQAARHALCAALLDEYRMEPADQADPLIVATRAWALSHLADPLTLDGLARHAGLSKYHFLRRYRRATGRTPMQDLRAMRIDHARGLLLGTGLALKEIAPLAGLGDEFALSRAFRRTLGASPRTFRRFLAGRGQRP